MYPLHTYEVAGSINLIWNPVTKFVISSLMSGSPDWPLNNRSIQSVSTIQVKHKETLQSRIDHSWAQYYKKYKQTRALHTWKKLVTVPNFVRWWRLRAFTIDFDFISKARLITSFYPLNSRYYIL
jgi:hypothetical protein